MKKVKYSKSGSKSEQANVGLSVVKLKNLGITKEEPEIEVKYLSQCVLIKKV